MQVDTIKGLIDLKDLKVIDETVVNGNTRVTVTKWYLGDELVRQDLLGNILSGIAVGVEQGNIE